MNVLPMLVLGLCCAGDPEPMLAGMRRSPWFGEQVREEWLEGDVRVLLNAPRAMDPRERTRLIIYATPNGNTIEQTLGCAKVDGLDWHFDIQHVAAQVRRLREVLPKEEIVIACVEADGLSWPAWRKTHQDASARIIRILTTIRDRFAATEAKVILCGHSEGGSFIFGLLDAADAIPGYVERIAFLDANYAYADAFRHGDKLLTWLKGGDERRLVVLAYDDREVMLDGKRVVGPDGGTFRATQRMLARFKEDGPLTESTAGEFVIHTGIDGRAVFHVHSNPKTRILHTALVGEMNGLLHAITTGDHKAPDWGTLGGPQAYLKWVQPAPVIPPRPVDAPGGVEVMKKVAGLSPSAREEVFAAEVLRGNVPDFLRKFHTVTVRAKDRAGREHEAAYEVMPDYLAIGSDGDFVRVPLTPATAQRVADAFGCTLPTRTLVDQVFASASLRLEPIPLTEKREAADTFARHNDLIQKQLDAKGPAGLVAGQKKDVVISNRLGEKSNRVAIYGWHKTDGTPIQPLTIVHKDTYVDYSHGIRLIKRGIVVDGKVRDVRHVLHSTDLHGLLSDEGPISHATY